MRSIATDCNETFRTKKKKKLVNRIGSALGKTMQWTELWGQAWKKMWKVMCDFEREARCESQDSGEASSQWLRTSLSLILCFSSCRMCVFIHWIAWDRTPAVCQACGPVGIGKWLRQWLFSLRGSQSSISTDQPRFLPACCGGQRKWSRTEWLLLNLGSRRSEFESLFCHWLCGHI